MTRINWNSVGTRYYETGVDRGVLYVNGENVPGVPWNGLVSIKEKPSGVTNTPYYFDGIKYLNTSTTEEYAATIEAYFSPEEFDQCDGTEYIKNGLYVTQQSKKTFGISYRTRVGNDLNGSDYAYKIHLVYNATASPSEQANNTITSVEEPNVFSWDINTIPSLITGFSPSSHFIIDSTKVSSNILYFLETIIYGDEINAPRLPTITELLTLFAYGVTLEIIDNGDGTWTAVGSDQLIEMISSTQFEITSPSAEMIDQYTYEISSF